MQDLCQVGLKKYLFKFNSNRMIRSWEEPFDESVYCLATDKVNCLVTGTARHGRVS